MAWDVLCYLRFFVGTGGDVRWIVLYQLACCGGLYFIPAEWIYTLDEDRDRAVFGEDVSFKGATSHVS